MYTTTILDWRFHFFLPQKCDYYNIVNKFPLFHCQPSSPASSSELPEASASWGTSGRCRPPRRFCMASKRLLTETLRSPWPSCPPPAAPLQRKNAFLKQILKYFCAFFYPSRAWACSGSLGLKLGSNDRKNMLSTLGSSKLGRPVCDLL